MAQQFLNNILCAAYHLDDPQKRDPRARLIGHATPEQIVAFGGNPMPPAPVVRQAENAIDLSGLAPAARLIAGTVTQQLNQRTVDVVASLPRDMQNEMDVDKFTSLNGLTEDALNEWRDSVGLNNVPELVKRAAGIPTTNKEARDKSGALRSVSVMQPVPLSQLRALTKEEIKAAANLDSNTLARLAALPAVGAAGGGAGGTLDLIMTLPDAQAHPAYVGRNKNFLLELGDLDNGELQALAGLAAAQVQELETMPDPARRALATLNPATLAGIGGAAFTPAVLQDLGNPASNAAVILGLLKTYMDQNGANPVALQTALNDVVTAVYPGVAGAPLVAPIGGGAWPAGAPAAGAIAMTQAVMQDLRNHPQALPALAAAGVTPAALLAGGTVVGAGGVPAPAAIAAAIQGAAAAPIAAANANALAQLSQLTLCALSVLNANTLLVLGALPQAVSGLGQLTFPTVTALGGLPAAALQDLANNAGAVAGFGVLGTGIVPAGAPAPAGTLAALAGAAAPVLSALRKNFVTQNSLRELRGVQAQLAGAVPQITATDLKDLRNLTQAQRNTLKSLANPVNLTPLGTLIQRERVALI